MQQQSPTSCDAIFAGRLMVMDGPMATMLQRPGPGAPACDLMNLTAPEAVRHVHRRYVAAGAEILRSNTFNSNALSFAGQPQDFLDKLNTEGVRLAREAAAEAAGRCLVAGVLGPTPANPESFADPLVDAFYRQAATLMDAGADFLMAETITHPKTLSAFLAAVDRLAAVRNRWIPAVVSVAPVRMSVEAFAGSLPDYKVLAMGVNCVRATDARPAVEFLARNTALPLCFYPSAGLPDAQGRYPDDDSEIASVIEGLARNGLLNVAGGCCGTTPEFIRRLSGSLRQFPARICR